MHFLRNSILDAYSLIFHSFIHLALRVCYLLYHHLLFIFHPKMNDYVACKFTPSSQDLPITRGTLSTCDTSIRRCKYSMALQALFKAKAIDEYDCDLFKCIYDFVCKLDTMKKENKKNDASAITTTKLCSIVYDTIIL